MSGDKNNDILKIISIVMSLAFKYGAPYVMSVLDDINNGIITQADIDNLRINKNPEDYLENHRRE